MESLKALLQEYKKTIATALVGLMLYFGKNNVPELFTPEVTDAFNTFAEALIMFGIGYFIRISGTEAKMLKDMKNNNV